jgi:hemin uptake protein HemP
MTVMATDGTPDRPPASPGRQGNAPATPSDVSTAPAGPLLISSEQLFAGASEVQIRHRGALYRLKKTSLGKLILTK